MVAGVGIVDECSGASVEDVMHDIGRWLAVGRGFGRRGRGVAVVGCVVGGGFRLIRAILVCECHRVPWCGGRSW